MQLVPKRRLGPLLILSFSQTLLPSLFLKRFLFSISYALSSLLPTTAKLPSCALSLFESVVPWKQLSRNFRAFPHHRCCWFLTEGSDRVLPTLALVFHSHGRESLHLCFCLDLGLSLGLCAFGRERPTTFVTTKGNESHTETSPIVLLLFCWFKSWLGDKDLVIFFFFFFLIWVWKVGFGYGHLWICGFFFFWDFVWKLI